MKISFKTNAAQLERELNQFMKKELPKVVAKTLTDIAKAAQKRVRDELPVHFTVRNQYVSRGIQIEGAEKRDWPHMSATVGTITPFMAIQETGGEKHLTSLEGFTPAPIQSRAREGGESAVIKPGMRPKKLMQLAHDKTHYHLETLKSSGHKAIVYRPKTKTYAHRAPPKSPLAAHRKQMRIEAMKKVRVLWALPERVTLKPKWNFFETVRKTVENLYEKTFGRELAKAIAKERNR